MKREYYTEAYFSEVIKRQIRYNLVARQKCMNEAKAQNLEVRGFLENCPDLSKLPFITYLSCGTLPFQKKLIDLYEMYRTLNYSIDEIVHIALPLVEAENKEENFLISRPYIVEKVYHKILGINSPFLKTRTLKDEEGEICFSYEYDWKGKLIHKYERKTEPEIQCLGTSIYDLRDKDASLHECFKFFVHYEILKTELKAKNLTEENMEAYFREWEIFLEKMQQVNSPIVNMEDVISNIKRGDIIKVSTAFQDVAIIRDSQEEIQNLIFTKIPKRKRATKIAWKGSTQEFIALFLHLHKIKAIPLINIWTIKAYFERLDFEMLEKHPDISEINVYEKDAPLEWTYLQRNLAELFVMLSELEFIEFKEGQRLLHLDNVLTKCFTKTHTISQLFKESSKSKSYEEKYDQIFTKNYKPMFGDLLTVMGK